MKKRISEFALAAAFVGTCVGLGGCVEADPLPLKPYEEGIVLDTHVTDWRNEVIYQLIVDRFHNGDINNDFNVDTRSMSRYHGGDWQGVIDKLDYLQELGVTTLWISPVVKNVEEDAGFASYHGYWTVDFLKHNAHFGDLATLRRLSDELHKRGMKLIIDIVTNHVGQVFFYDINMNGQPNEWLAGAGQESVDKGSDRGEHELSPLTRVTEYDPDFQAGGISAYTSMGISGRAPIVFLDMPSINRYAPGPKNIDLDGDGRITSEIERMGFSNPEWYHQLGRTYDYDNQYDAKGNKMSPPYTHRLTNYDGTEGAYLDGDARQYYQNDQTLLGDFPGGLKDVATEREDVRRAMVAVFSYWIDVTDCDGFRIDTLKHVEYSFWEHFAQGIREHAAKRGKKNFLMFGEAFDGNDNMLAAYTGPNQVDSVFLFSQKYAIDQAFKCAPGNAALYCKGTQNGTSALYGWDNTWSTGGRHELFSNTPQPGGVIDAEGNGVAPRELLVNFLDNHDVGRYLFDRNDEKGVDSLKNALSFLFMQRGIPCLYYGTEQGFMGGNDPGNREDMWNTNASIFTQYPDIYPNYQAWDTGNPLFRHIKHLIEIRNEYDVLRLGKVNANQWHSTHTDNAEAGIYAFSKSLGNAHAVIVVNTHEARESATQGSMGDGAMPMPADGTYVDVLNSDGYSVTASGGKALIKVPPMTTRIMIKQ